MLVGKGPFPGAVLVHDSGPNDRDESLGPDKLFRDLAEGLASRGAAVLRHDERRSAAIATVKNEVIDDAVAALALLRSTAGVDAKRVFVAGHSLGGMVASRIAEADPSVAGVIPLAGAALPMEDAVARQVKYIAGLQGDTSPHPEAGESVKRMAPESYWRDLSAYHPA